MMKFQDSAGGWWDLDTTIGNVMRLKTASKGRFDLFEPKSDLDGKPLGEQLDENDGLFWEMLCQLVEPQVLEKQLTIEKFGKLLAADCWPIARKNFFEAWIDFFHKLQRPDKALPL